MWTDGVCVSCLNIVPVNLLSHIFLLHQTLWCGLDVKSEIPSVTKRCLSYYSLNALEVCLWPPTCDRRGAAVVLSSRVQEHIQGLVVRHVHQVHLLQHVHVHLHGRHASYWPCRWDGEILAWHQTEEGSGKGQSPGTRCFEFCVSKCAKQKANGHIQAGWHWNGLACVHKTFGLWSNQRHYQTRNGLPGVRTCTKLYMKATSNNYNIIKG